MPSEIHALLTMRRLLAELQPGLLEPHVRPLLDRLNGLLEQGERSVGDIEKRVRILQTAQRAAELRHFEPVATALFERRRLRLLSSGPDVEVVEPAELREVVAERLWQALAQYR
ncbi:MAG: hypothetical protein AB1648_11220 [Pseudomonadota bacterium]